MHLIKEGTTRKTEAELKSFGLSMALIFSLFSMYAFYRGRDTFLYLCLLIALFGLTAIIKPSWLFYVDKFWSWLGETLGKIMTPVIMGLIYYLVITPIGLIMRIAGKDLLDQRIDKNASSYWIKADSMGSGSRYFTPY